MSKCNVVQSEFGHTLVVWAWLSSLKIGFWTWFFTFFLFLFWQTPRLNPSNNSHLRFNYRIRYDAVDGTESGSFYRSAETMAVGERLTYTIGSLERNKTYSIQLRLQARYLSCYNYNFYGDYSDRVVFKTNATRT